MRQQLSQVLNRIPKVNETTAGGSVQIHGFNIGDVDLGKGNTTSVTKVSKIITKVQLNIKR